MNYTKHYELLIERARNRSILPTEYKERHHIQPRCMGGPDDRKNLVDLLPEEHLIAHLLLTKIYPDHEGLLYGAFMMSNYRRITNKKYGWLKKQYAEMVGKRFTGATPWNKGKPWSDEMKEKISLSKKGVCTMTDLQRKKQSEDFKGEKNPMFENGHSQETKDKLSKMYKGRTLSDRCGDQGARNIIEAAKKKYECKYCGKKMNYGNLNRWHNDNCKHKEK